ncbi:MAG: hypothetical protein ALECFALPRED_005035 [Alectoria fallacina]|uniref:Dienelactone hydrolase domain-containing protein n=1 Tax=Alectoria fallacina TaxID=1903189 RepID=A0A8H3IXW0_9LECA|nr:MAG: hypothetical protein ALECFALPRED_005035 [Alectoria fallacina]
MAQHGHSEARCTVPPARAEYSEKGSYIEIEGVKLTKVPPPSSYTFSTSSASALRYIRYEYHPKTYRETLPILVYRVPPSSPTPIKATATKSASPIFSMTVAAIPSVIKDIEAKAGYKIEKWGSVEIVYYSCGPGGKFSAASEAHPATVNPNDAPNIAVPMYLLTTGDEDAEAFEAFKKTLKVPSQVYTFGDQVHSFMAARGDLKDEKVRTEYERGYQTLLDFFHKYLPYSHCLSSWQSVARYNRFR